MHFAGGRSNCMDKAMLDVEVAYALANKQKIVELRVAEGTTVRQAAMLSGLDREFPRLDLAGSPLGIFGRAVSKPVPMAALQSPWSPSQFKSVAI